MQELDTDSGKTEESQSGEVSSDSDGTPKFGRLLLLLAFGVAIVVALTFGSQAYYMP